ncbi:MAG: hypothetical protein P8J20_11200 [Novosphingobium sp.]|nr:hypothetical protein [Novosphingobium sp.]
MPRSKASASNNGLSSDTPCHHVSATVPELECAFGQHGRADYVDDFLARDGDLIARGKLGSRVVMTLGKRRIYIGGFVRAGQQDHGIVREVVLDRDNPAAHFQDLPVVVSTGVVFVGGNGLGQIGGADLN